MGVRTFYINCRRKEFQVTEAQCADLREAWFNLYPEMQDYIEPKKDGVLPASVFEGTARKDEEDNENDLEAMEEAADSIDGGAEDLVQLYQADTVFGQHRARATYASANNFPFQAGASTVSKLALWYVYLDGLVNGYKIVDFIHKLVDVKESELLEA